MLYSKVADDTDAAFGFAPPFRRVLAAQPT